jgi:hypothetical protein
LGKADQPADAMEGSKVRSKLQAMCGDMLIILPLAMLRQEDSEFKASLGYIVSQKKKKKKKKEI